MAPDFLPQDIAPQTNNSIPNSNLNINVINVHNTSPGNNLTTIIMDELGLEGVFASNKDTNDHCSTISNLDIQPNNAEICNSISDNIFSIDYSKRGTAKCKKCKKIIAKGVVRIGKKVPFKVGHIVQFFHLECAFQSFLKAKRKPTL